MAHRDKEVGPATEPDWRRLYEQTLNRAEAAEARADELKWAEVAARTEAGSWKSRFEAARRKRQEADEETRRVRRVAKDAPFLQSEVARLTRLLREAGVDPRRRSTILSLRMEVERLRKAVPGAEVQARKIRQLNKALRRLRRRKTALNALRKENARLRRIAKASQGRVETLEAELLKQRSTAAVLSKTLFGRRSEKLEAPGTGRTPRPGVEEWVEVPDPPAEARRCDACGKPYAANGADESSLLEIEVRAHRRVIRRPRWRRGCDCASVPLEVSAPPVPRLFPNTAFGTSVWSRVLYEHYACRRPLHRVSGWLGDQGLPAAPGTLADSAPRFVPLFEPLAEAIRAHQNESVLRQADETGWRVQELRGEGRSGRAWLWASVTGDSAYFHIDPSRSAEAALRLFGDLAPGTVLVCDRYSVYKKLARLLEGPIILSFCWAHNRCDVIDCAAGQPHLAGWCRAWLERVAAIYRLNKVRLSHYDAALACQSAEFDRAQVALVAALDRLFERASRELAGLPDEAREGKALRSLVNHREGAERVRGPPAHPHGQQFLRASDPGTGDRTAPVVRLRLADRRDTRRAHVLGGRHPDPEQHRRAALARGVACGVRTQRRPAAGRPRAVAALVDG